MLELRSQPTPESSQPLSKDEICKTILGMRPDYSKGLGYGPKLKSRKTTASKRCTPESQGVENKLFPQHILHDIGKSISDVGSKESTLDAKMVHWEYTIVDVQHPSIVTVSRIGHSLSCLRVRNDSPDSLLDEGLDVERGLPDVVG
ncbi:uncharacterized protein E5676_scaffold403G001140 [Cucumis melo var. makuwa]|uniref:Uncharacterized protein n=1 Tax=Cucumis melo var. makuwa TaxID=1194695 RepID=A0A5D3DZC6_CUCMM|nr:uncharacterized protein E5676_scaffold403G001140 [Cucumis melo var. makuwa]